ncbi:hypothetical protein BSE24067_06715 [Burkholderia seminalis]|nr:hypothetical protein BSE24067_06715 [Burkholderia seminalis]
MHQFIKLNQHAIAIYIFTPQKTEGFFYDRINGSIGSHGIVAHPIANFPQYFFVCLFELRKQFRRESL